MSTTLCGLRRRAWRALLALTVLAAAPAALALPVTVHGPLADADRRAVDSLLLRTAAVLPAPLARRLPALALHLSDTLPAHVQGRQHGHDILLPRQLVLASPGEGGDPARAALLHEIAHVLDRELGLSREPRLLDLAGWQLRPRRFGLRAPRNPIRDRSPDPYELVSPAEFLAVNLEHFLLDPQYRCRRPALHRHLAARLGHPGATQGQPCADALPFVRAPPGDDARLALEAIDPARVHAIDYLFAEPTRAPMSRWGHSMLRLVVCAPGRAPGPDCRFDLAHHRVLSFRAFVDDLQISSLRGLTGGYPSRLFVLPLSQVVDEYTRVELRGLRSLPLRLEADEIAAIIERAAQLHWNYDGRYSFLGTNCATETFRLLHDAVPRLATQRLAALSPNGLLRKLQRRGIADASVLADPDEATRLGFHFPAADAHFDALFAVAASSLPLPAGDARAWFGLDAGTRATWLERGDLRASAALLVLEDAALQRALARARDALKRRLVHSGDEEAADLRSRTLEALAAEGQLARPALLLSGLPGYGLPQAGELQQATLRAHALDAGRRDDADAVPARAGALLPPALQRELAGTRANLERIGARLRRLGAGETAGPTAAPHGH